MNNEKVINKILYRVHFLPVQTAMRLGLQLVKVVGPGLAHLAEGLLQAKKDDKDKAKDKRDENLQALKNLDLAALDIDLSKVTISKAVEALVNGVDQSTLDEFTAELAAVSEVKLHGKWHPLPNAFDSHFMGKLPSLLQWLAFAVQVNFANFLEGSGDLLEQTNGQQKG